MNDSGQSQCKPLCPYALRVKALCSGDLEPHLITVVEAHLAGCPSCGEIADAADHPSDSVIQTLATLPGSDDDEPEFRQLESRLMAATPAGISDPTRHALRRLADPPLGPLPQTLGNYELLACIGRGAWGAVFRARHTKLDQIVAVKVLDAARLAPGPVVERFVQEMKIAGQLRHRNIVRATDAGEARGFHFLVMEFVDGIDVARVLQQTGPLAVADACEIVRQASTALAFAHRCAWVHRDVKPSNLMLTYEGTVKLLDLGVAGRRGPGDGHPGAWEQEHERDRQGPLGTADYMAPEQWSDCRMVDARADVYSLGCTLFKLLTGRLPYDRISDGPVAAREHAPSASVRAFRSDVNRGLDRFIDRMIARAPENRVASAADVADALARYSRRANLQKLASQLAGPETGSDCDSFHASPTDSEVLARVGRSSRRRWLTGAAAVAGAAFVAQWFPLDRSPRLRRREWRDLQPATRAVLLALEPRNAIDFEVVEAGHIVVRSEELALVNLGRVVSGRFSFQVVLQQNPWRGDAGVFFRGLPSEHDNLDYEFQSVELRPLDHTITPPVRRLLWSSWNASMLERSRAVHRDPLAEAAVELDPRSAGQRLRITFGRAGFPEFHWNGRTIRENEWTFSTEARRLQSLTSNQASRHYLGQLGLVNAGGTTTFVNPRLAYL